MKEVRNCSKRFEEFEFVRKRLNRFGEDERGSNLFEEV